MQNNFDAFMYMMHRYVSILTFMDCIAVEHASKGLHA